MQNIQGVGSRSAASDLEFNSALFWSYERGFQMLGKRGL